MARGRMLDRRLVTQRLAPRAIKHRMEEVGKDDIYGF